MADAGTPPSSGASSNPAAPADSAALDEPASSADDSTEQLAKAEARWGAGGLTLSGSLSHRVEQPPTVYAAVGGQRFFDELVNRFYDAVENDELLRPMYPADMGPSRRRLAGFLAQYWGGPSNYSAERGHPRLRMRHLPFVIGQPERDAWMTLMLASLAKARMPDGSPLVASIADAMAEVFGTSATHLMNQPDADQPATAQPDAGQPG